MDKQNLYTKLPVFLQNIAVSFEGRKIKRTRYGEDFKRMLDAYSARSYASPAEIIKLRNKRLGAFLASACREVPFYKKYDQTAQYVKAEVKEWLKEFPVITKQDVQGDIASFINPTWRHRDTMWAHTSGTTGGGLVFPLTRNACLEQWAVWWRYRYWHGIELDEPCLYFGGRSVVPVRQKKPPFWRYNKPGRQILFSAYHLGEDTAGYYLDEVERSRFQWIHGYPSVISLLAAYAVQAGRKIPMRWVSTGAESLLEHQKHVIKSAFAVSPIEHYGMAEGVANISRCPRGNMHVDEDYAYVEFIANETDGYHIVGSNFTNMAFPLIRYRVGDVVDMVQGQCDCGRPGRVVKSIEGRVEDYIVTKNGRKLGRLDHIFKDMMNIKEAQIRQEKKGHMTLLVVKSTGYDVQDEQKLKKDILMRVGNEVDFEIVYVSTIPKTPGNKLKFVISSVDE